jgi:glycosyltransferase involved in cell wall biosynthesis
VQGVVCLVDWAADKSLRQKCESRFVRILLVTHFFPYPPNDGGRLGYFNPIKYLSRNNEVVLASMIEPGELQYVSEMKNYCLGVETYLRPCGLDSWRLTRGLLFDPPGSASKFWDSGFENVLRKCIARYAFDIVEFEHLNTAAYRRVVKNVPCILREHNVEYKVWERYAEQAQSNLEKWYVARCAPRVRAYEAKMAPRFARCLTVSNADARHLADVAPTARVEAIPSGVDTEYFYPSPEVAEEPYRMVLTGSFEWKPKQHNLRVLLAEIMPRIRANVPEATLYVVGKGVPDELRRLGERTPGVTVTGMVPDVRPYLSQSSLVLNYLESGGGIALKVLEAMAMRKPVLSNSLGCEGIEVSDRREVCLADGPEDFAAAAARLLEDRVLRESIAEGGYRKVLVQYGWGAILPRLERLYESVLEQHSRDTLVRRRAKQDSEETVTIAD